MITVGICFVAIHVVTAVGISARSMAHWEIPADVAEEEDFFKRIFVHDYILLGASR